MQRYEVRVLKQPKKSTHGHQNSSFGVHATLSYSQIRVFPFNKYVKKYLYLLLLYLSTLSLLYIFLVMAATLSFRG